MGDDMTKPIACGSCCCLVLIASSIMLGCSFGVLDPTQFALDYDTVSCGRTPAPCSTSATLTAAPAPNLAPPPFPHNACRRTPNEQVNFQINDAMLYTGGRHFIGLGHVFIVFPNTLQTVRMGTVQEGEEVDGETVTTSSLLAHTEDGLQAREQPRPPPWGLA